MSAAALAYKVSFTVNACRTDARFFDKTLRHMLRALNYPFSERLIAYDAGQPEGKYRARSEGGDDEMRAILRRLRTDDIVDRVDEVPWGGGDGPAVIKKYFGHDDVTLRDFAGAPVYQYLYALARCSGDYVFHADGDMLFHCSGSRSWIDEAVEMMRHNPRAPFARLRGPPQSNPRAPAAAIADEPRWHRAEEASTRYFLLDRHRFEREVLPLLWMRAGQSLESSLTHTFKRKGFEVWSITGEDNWAIHPVTHGDNFIEHLDDLIWAVEAGVYPRARPGNRWDLCTEGDDIAPWLAAIRAARTSP